MACLVDDCHRSELEAEIADLRALVQQMVDALDEYACNPSLCERMKDGSCLIEQSGQSCGNTAHQELARAAAHGFTPTERK